MKREEDIRNHLVSNNAVFKRLVEEHQSYDSRLQELTSRPHKNENELMEQVQLKKQKLQLKDQMSRIIQEFRQGEMSHQHP